MVEIQNDHKPLEITMKKPLACVSARVQCMMLRLHRYELKWTWCPGNTMHVSDALSMAYIEGTADQELIDDIEVMVYSAQQNFPANDVMMDCLVIATQEDLTMQCLIKVTGYGWPEKCSSLPADLESFWHIRDELTCSDGLVYAGQRLIVPTTMRKELYITCLWCQMVAVFCTATIWHHKQVIYNYKWVHQIGMVIG